MPAFGLRALIPPQLRSGSVLRSSLSVGRHILFDYGWLRTASDKVCVDGSGEPVPWFTYPAIDFLNQLDFSRMDVFEWGAGFSTAYWSKHARSVVSVETNPDWIARVKGMTGANCELLLSEREVATYVRQIEKYDGFDIIIIDGTGQSRKPCSMAAPAKLRSGGMIILDNADMWPDSARILREADLIEVDFAGLAPGEAHWHTTSIFLSRQFAVLPRHGQQPIKCAAQPSEPWPNE